jgi:dTDP-4-amino-4,6-dideoxygalactose transaminase
MSGESFIVFGQPDLREEDFAAVEAALRSLWIGTGPRTQEFERQIGRFVDAPYAIGVNSCTSALHLGLLLSGVGPGDEVVVPAMTFASTANVVVHCGATPIFADVDRTTRCLTADGLEAALSPRTKAAIPVHLAGYPCDLDALEEVADRAGIALVVDAAHGLETQLRGRPIGGRGRATAYSFYVTKNITTAEGGMLTTSHRTIAERAGILNQHGLSTDAWSRYSDAKTRTYEVREPGYKYNLTDLQAALGLSQLARIEEALARRVELWERYDEAFADLPLELPPVPAPSFGRSARHLYSPLLDLGRVPFSREELRERLHERGIGTGVHFTALHLHPYYRERSGLEPGALPVAELIGRTTFSLPLSPRLSDGEAGRVVDAVRAELAQYR